MKYLKIGLLAALLFITGCSQGKIIYDDPDNVSIYLYDEPVVTRRDYSITFRFKHNDDDATHFIQKISWNWREGKGIESFRSYNGKLPHGQKDHHFNDSVLYERREMTIMTGKVEGADETWAGFAMLPSDWPDDFNEKYRKGHKIQGSIVDVNPETATVYILEFNDGELVFEVEGTEVKYVWTATSADAAE